MLFALMLFQINLDKKHCAGYNSDCFQTTDHLANSKNQTKNESIEKGLNRLLMKHINE